MTESGTPSRVTLQDVADLCGVTKATVSLALREDRQISVATTRRVRAAAETLGYDASAHHAARRLSLLRRGEVLRNRIIGVLGPHSLMRDAYSRRLAGGVFDTLIAEQYGVLYVSAGAGPTAPPGVHWSDPLVRGEIDGLVAFGDPAATVEVREIRARSGFGSRPAVALIDPVPDCAAVVADEETGGYEACKHLLELGHRRFLQLVYGGDDPDGAERPRRRGLRRAMREAGLDTDACLDELTTASRWMDPSFTKSRLSSSAMDDAGKALVAFLEARPEITAIFADNDSMAIHAFASLRLAGVDVPGRVSLVGFDDTDALPGPAGENFLSSVALPLEDIGREGVGILLRAIEGGGSGRERLTLPTQFRPRGSVGPARTRRA